MRVRCALFLSFVYTGVMRNLIFLFVISLAGCVYYEPPPKPIDEYELAMNSVVLYPEGHNAPDGVSLGHIEKWVCRQNPNYPLLTEEQVIGRLKYEAYLLGANAVAGTIIEKGRFYQQDSCWHWVKASGVALKVSR